MNVKEANNSDSSKLVEREPVEGTPLWIVKTNDKWNIIFNKYKLNQVELDNKEDCLQYIADNIFNLIIMVYQLIKIIENETLEKTPTPLTVVHKLDE